jgi:type I restriction enzyme, S subunit
MSLNLDRSTWKRVRFGDVVKNLNETVRDPQKVGIDRVIAMDHLDSGELKTNRWGEIADGTTFTRRVRPGQTLFGKRRAYQRKAAFAEFEAVCSGDILVFEARPQQLLGTLLPFLVQSEGFYNHAIGTSAGSLSPRTNWKDLAKFEFDIPSLEQQQRIADLMWSVESHRASLRRLIQNLTVTSDAYFIERAESGGWPFRAAADVLSEGPRNGLSLPANDRGVGRPTLSISAIRGGVVTPEGSVKYVDVPDDKVAPFVLRRGDFLVVRGNGNKDLVARGGLVSGTEGLPLGTFYPDLLIRLRFDADQVLPSFGALCWNAKMSHDALLASAKTTNGTWKINGKDVREHRLMIPTLDEQSEVVQVVLQIEAGRGLLVEELEACDRLRDAVLSEISG